MGSALRPFLEDYSEVECTVHEGKHWDVLEGLYNGVTELARYRPSAGPASIHS